MTRRGKRVNAQLVTITRGALRTGERHSNYDGDGRAFLLSQAAHRTPSFGLTASSRVGNNTITDAVEGVTLELTVAE